MRKAEKQRRTSVIFGTIIVILMVAAVVSASMSYNSIRDESINTITQHNQAVVNQIDGWINLKKGIVEHTAIMLRTPFIDFDWTINHFSALIHRYADISDVYAGFPDGMGISGLVGGVIDTGIWPDFIAFERPWYLEALENPGEVVFTTLYWDMNLEQLAFAAVRTIDNYGDSQGVVAVDVPFEVMLDFINTINAAASVSTIILDGDGYILLHDNPEFIPACNEVALANKALVGGGRYAEMVYYVLQGKDYTGGGNIYVGTDLETTGWTVITRTPTAQLISGFAPALMGITSSVLLAVVALAWAALMIRSDRRAMEKEREAHEMNEIFFNNSPFVMTVWNKDWEMIRTSPQVVQMFGLEREEQYATEFNKLMPENQPCGRPSREMLREHLKDAFNNGFTKFEWMRQTLNGEPLPTEVTISRFLTASGYMAVAFTVDLRPVKNAMENVRIAREESLAKTRFLARMSHELRTPMNVVLGITEIELQKGGHPAETEEAFLRIRSSSSLLRTIINDILDLSQVEAGKLEINPTEYEVASLISDTVQMNKLLVGEKNIDFSLTADENLPSRLIGDELRIKQILNNLLTNAFKYTREGKVSIAFEAAPSAKEDGVVLTVIVRDTGQGMSKEQLGQLFRTEFTRYNLEDNESIEGSGLGLNITYSLIKMMHGDIDVESELGKGTAFTVRLPQKVKNKQVLGKELASNLHKFTFSGDAERSRMHYHPMPYGRVLIVDDTESNLYVAKGIMKPYGLNIETAESARDTIAKIEAGNEYDIIFMDHMMPDIDGIQATKILRKLGYGHPIIALTANTLVDSVDLFLNNGFTGFISKPIDIEHLDEYLMRYIRDKHEKYGGAGIALNSAKMTESAPMPLDDDLVKFCISDAKKVLSVLEYITASRRADEATLRNSTMQLHSAKSILNNLGKLALSNIASLLENAARKGESEIILSDLPAFIAEFKQTIAELSEPAAPSAGTADENLPFLREQLLAIEAACANYDSQQARNAVAALRQKPHSAETAALLDKITELLLLSEFEECAALTKETAEKMK